MIDLTVGLRRAHHRNRLTKGTEHGIRVWLDFLSTFNGRSFFFFFFFHGTWNTSSFIELYTDAAESKGYVAILGQRWFFGPFPYRWQSFNITFLELFPIAFWSRHMSIRCIVFGTDNAALVGIINQQTSQHKLVMILIRALVLTSLRHNIFFSARLLAGFISPVGDNGHTWAALSPIRCFTSHLIHV